MVEHMYTHNAIQHNTLQNVRLGFLLTAWCRRGGDYLYRQSSHYCDSLHKSNTEFISYIKLGQHPFTETLFELHISVKAQHTP